eukprot:213239-Chlamydomonas_euryale.AAC.1
MPVGACKKALFDEEADGAFPFGLLAAAACQLVTQARRAHTKTRSRRPRRAASPLSRLAPSGASSPPPRLGSSAADDSNLLSWASRGRRSVRGRSTGEARGGPRAHAVAALF